MSLTYKKSALSAFNGSGLTTSAVFGTGGNTAGNMLLLAVRWTGAVTITGVADTLHNSWVQIGSQYTEQGFNFAVFYVQSNQSTGANTVVVTWSADTTADASVVAEYSGEGTNELDSFVDANGSTTSLNTGNLVANFTNETLIALGTTTAGNAVSAASIGTIRQAGNVNDCFLIDVNETAAGTYAITATSGSAWSLFFAGFTSTTSGFSISGSVGSAAVGATISYTGTSSGSVIAGAGGAYTIPGLVDGSYTITPTLTGYTFSPTSSNQTVAGANITGVNFTAQPTGGGAGSGLLRLLGVN